MDAYVISVMKYLPIIKMGIYALIILATIMIIFRLFNIRSVTLGKGISKALNNTNVMRSRDAYIISTNKLIRNIARIVQNSAFGLDNNRRDYIQYNLNRVQLKTVGGRGILTAEEFNGIQIAVTFIGLFLSLVVMLFTNITTGVVLILACITSFNILPMNIIRTKVKQKDSEIADNFLFLYLVLHYQLMEGAKGSISKTMRDYSGASNSKEIKEFINIAAGYMDSYGEEEALMRIRSDYREVSQIVKLTRLIKQLYDGAEIKNDLIGFRSELIIAKERVMEAKRDKLIARAIKSFNILWIIVVQAVVSALSIYMSDIGFILNLMG